VPAEKAVATARPLWHRARPTRRLRCDANARTHVEAQQGGRPGQGKRGAAQVSRAVGLVRAARRLRAQRAPTAWPRGNAPAGLQRARDICCAASYAQGRRLKSDTSRCAYLGSLALSRHVGHALVRAAASHRAPATTPRRLALGICLRAEAIHERQSGALWALLVLNHLFCVSGGPWRPASLGWHASR
jgi:hypothetical protein